ncbi:tegument protein UL88 [Panine betaherpesvirus 2]|uniref:Tegument protein UL88 n=1 Tax=Panine betaherpesvirus 2 TaxID=188763 RepID=Q8QS11_9BETA|nr:tegument protein UL88 [Panine betaherpesvirus 2]AAM00727.1 tegument protein UL88 [Panine betaherpesvirus 2]QXV67837.1 tegument protein UL88 [Panine betaherpesvirus 2]
MMEAAASASATASRLGGGATGGSASSSFLEEDDRLAPGWRDAALVQGDGSVREHAFKNVALSELVRRVIPPPPDADEGVVFASELSLYSSGRVSRISSVFSIYWQGHSELVYILTGLTHCTKLVVECGQMKGTVTGDRGWDGDSRHRHSISSPHHSGSSSSSHSHRSRHTGYSNSRPRHSHSSGSSTSTTTSSSRDTSSGGLGDRDDRGRGAGSGAMAVEDDLLYEVPGIYMIRVSDGNMGPRNVVWPKTSVLWAPDVEISTVRRHSAAVRAFASALRNYMFWMGRRSQEELEVCPPEVEDHLAPLLRGPTRGDSEIFDGLVGSAYQRLRQSDIPRSSSLLLEHCVGMASLKKLLLLDLPRLENFYLCQVCLYELDEDEVGEEMLGMLAGRPGDSGDAAEFFLHRKTMKVAACLALMLNCLHKYQEGLSTIEQLQSVLQQQRLDENDLILVALRRYYRHRTGVHARTLAAAKALISEFAENFSPMGSYTRLGFDRLGALDAEVSIQDLVAVLRA